MTTAAMNQRLERDGFMVLPFPEQLRELILVHITNTVFSRLHTEGFQRRADRDLDELVCNLPAEIFERLVGRQAFRIFPRTIANEVLKALEPSLQDATGATAFKLLPALDRYAVENRNLTGDEYFMYWRLYCPSCQESTPAHADIQFNRMHAHRGELRLSRDVQRIWKVWAPIVGCTQTNSLQVLPESHRWSVPFCSAVRDGIEKPSIQPDWLSVHFCEFECPLPKDLYGNAILFDERLVHRGPANNTPHARISIDFEVLELNAVSKA